MRPTLPGSRDVGRFVDDATPHRSPAVTRRQAFAAIVLAVTVASCGDGVGPAAPGIEPDLKLVGLGSSGLTAEVASEVSLSARVEDATGGGYAGAIVTWSVDGSSGSIISGAESTSDATGHVGAVWRLGTAAGPQLASARLVSGDDVTIVAFEATAEPGPAVVASLVADTVLLSGRGETVFLAPTYADEHGNETAGSGVAWSSSDPDVASVAEDGLVTASAEGQSWILASLGQPVDSILVTVEMRGAITVTFDDGWRSVYENAWPVMQELGLPANVGVYVEAVDRGFAAYMASTHLDELHDAGWSMVSHTVSHVSLSTLSEAEMYFELRASQEWLEARGYAGSNVLIAPYHEFGPAERAAVADVYTAARGTSAEAFVPDSLVGWMPDNPYLLTGVEADALPYTEEAGRSRLRDLLQRTLDEGVFMDLYFHQVPPENADAFREALMIVAEFSDRVLPYHQLYPVFARAVF